MKGVFYQPKDGWVGDTIPFTHDGKYYIFYLHDKRNGNSEDEYGYRTGWNLLVTNDGVNITDYGEVLPAGEYDDADYACYTGSVIMGKDGKFHIFYTAQNNYNPGYHKEGRPLQFVAHAVSDDLIHWTKIHEDTFGADESVYEPWDWRDPFVFYNEEEDCYYMLLAARLAGASEKNGGCVGLCQSKDLIHWDAKEPFFNPGSYMTHECPDLFRMGGKWYLVYSTFSEKFVTHYRYADSIRGPWLAPIEDTFDGRAFYAAKTAMVNGERFAFAWVPTKRGDSDFGQYEWGGALITHKIQQQSDGRLTVQPPDALVSSFQTDITPEKYAGEMLSIANSEGKKGVVIGEMPGTCMIEADIEFSENTRYFELAVRQNESLAEGYYLRLEPFHNRVIADMWPRRVPGVNQWYIDGDTPFLIELERPLDYKKLQQRKVHLRLIADGSILSLYVNDEVALTTRAYSTKHTHWGFTVDEGSIKVTNIHMYQNS